MPCSHTRKHALLLRILNRNPSSYLSFAASVKPHPDGLVSLHSTTSLPIKSTPTRSTFLSRLKYGTQASLWKSTFFDEDGDWVISAAQNCSLVIVHDGSYMPDLDPSVCSAAVVITCTMTGKVGRIQVCEMTAPDSASNYRAEIIGGLLASHILFTLDGMITGDTSGVKIYCDNLGVVHHAQHPFRTLRVCRGSFWSLQCPFGVPDLYEQRPRSTPRSLLFSVH